MDEFLVAIMSGIALLTYTIFSYLFTKSAVKVQARWIILGTIAVLIVLYLIKRAWQKRRWTKMGLDAEAYMYYQKYTSFGNKFSYILTYILQDFVYEVKKTNKAYNFSKGMFRFDDSLGEYYIDCRIAWYSYFRTNLLKNRLSLHKLRIFSLNKCNQMIINLYPEQEQVYKQVKKAWEEACNEVPPYSKVKKSNLRKLEGSKELHKMILGNLYQMERSRKFMKENSERYQMIMKKTERRKDDVREIKNFHVDLGKEERR